MKLNNYDDKFNADDRFDLLKKIYESGTKEELNDFLKAYYNNYLNDLEEKISERNS